MNIAIISGSIRENASTRRVALHLYHRLSHINGVQPLLIDLTDYEYPLWKEVFHREINPPRYVWSCMISCKQPTP
jgi:NAD(P)H-dependent FMN reductase